MLDNDDEQMTEIRSLSKLIIACPRTAVSSGSTRVGMRARAHPCQCETLLAVPGLSVVRTCRDRHLQRRQHGGKINKQACTHDIRPRLRSLLGLAVEAVALEVALGLGALRRLGEEGLERELVLDREHAARLPLLDKRVATAGDLERARADDEAWSVLLARAGVVDDLVVLEDRI